MLSWSLSLCSWKCSSSTSMSSWQRSLSSSEKFLMRITESIKLISIRDRTTECSWTFWQLWTILIASTKKLKSWFCSVCQTFSLIWAHRSIQLSASHGWSLSLISLSCLISSSIAHQQLLGSQVPVWWASKASTTKDSHWWRAITTKREARSRSWLFKYSRS